MQGSCGALPKAHMVSYWRDQESGHRNEHRAPAAPAFCRNDVYVDL